LHCTPLFLKTIFAVEPLQLFFSQHRKTDKKGEYNCIAQGGAMKKQTVLPFLVAVLVLSLACQTLTNPGAQASPTPPILFSTPETPAPQTGSAQLAGLTYATHDSGTDSNQLWQIGSDGKAVVISESGYAIFSPDGTQAAYIDFNGQCSWLLDYEKKEARPLDCTGSNNPEFFELLLAVLVLGIQHHSESSSDGLWRKVWRESSSNNSIVSVGLDYFTPVYSEFAVC